MRAWMAVGGWLAFTTGAVLAGLQVWWPEAAPNDVLWLAIFTLGVGGFMVFFPVEWPRLSR